MKKVTKKIVTKKPVVAKKPVVTMTVKQAQLLQAFVLKNKKSFKFLDAKIETAQKA